ncbi:hypothetical protein [Mucilaginibacter antarcticus]|uniref:Uncharacterized protein n=1 Tax=Mucilaginibacter antarcticus TaxID=1855725 RepID=A0ABW5XQV9_9SPHI
MNRKLLFAFLLLLSAFSSKAQDVRFNPDTIRTIVIDSPVNIRSHKLNAQDFIDAVLADTGFYKAFRNMKRYGFTAANDIYTYDKNNKVEGEIHRRIRHSIVNGKPKTEYLLKQDKGKIYKKNGKYDLYTVEMFDYIFDNAYKSEFSAADPFEGGGGGKNGSYKAKAKTLIFSPGRRVPGIPFISSKTEIFSSDMRQFYRYEFARGKYLDTIPVYRFKVIRKSSTSDSDVMINELTTIFDMRDFKILGRYVDMRFDNIFVDFNVKMNIELVPYNGELLPAKMSYQGNWDIPLHKEERSSFLILHKDYHK